MLDTIDEATELATTYGFELFTESGVAAALLVKVGHIGTPFPHIWC